MSGEVEYRRCDENDVDVLCALGMYTFRVTFSDTTAESDMLSYLVQAYSHNQVLRELTDPDSMFYLATVGGTPAGYMKLNTGAAQTEPMGDRYLEVQRLYVIPEFKRHHIGTGFMNLAFDAARRSRLPKMWLGVWEHNDPAQAFYQRMGYTFFSEHTFLVGADPQRDLLMSIDVPDLDED